MAVWIVVIRHAKPYFLLSMNNHSRESITARPVVVISKCLEFEACRYNGEKISFDWVAKLREHVTFVPVCPEIEIGLGVPRDPIRIVRLGDDLRLIQPATGRDITGEMEKFAGRFLDSVTEVDGFIFKSRSPSCGIRDTKLFSDNVEELAKGKTAGFFGRAVMDRHNGLAIEDEFRLADPRTRDHWLIKLHLHSRFRQAQATESIASLEHFHDDNRLLLMAYDQYIMRGLDRLISNDSERPEPEQWALYRRLMLEALGKPMRSSPQVNALSWAMGHFRDHLGSGEKREFLGMLAQFQAGRLPRSAVIDRLNIWIERYANEFLRRQSYFCPYPADLIDSPGERVQ
jgi:uncharacterized protein YbbK (DUF523 family)/uncharacterized protein YbgA (DUF1722 family)